MKIRHFFRFTVANTMPNAYFQSIANELANHAT